MNFVQSLEPREALGHLIFSHRQGWDGTICRNAGEWNCGSPSDFRSTHCDRGEERCNVVHIFDPHSPSLLISSDHIGWVLNENFNALDNQILFLFSKSATEPLGLSKGRTHNVLAGAYRIKKTEIAVSSLSRRLYRIIPHAEDWTEIHRLGISPPAYRDSVGSTVKISQREAIEQKFAEARIKFEDAPEKMDDAALRDRFIRFCAKLPSWLDSADKKRRELLEQAVDKRPSTSINNPFDNIKIPVADKIAASPDKSPPASSETVGTAAVIEKEPEQPPSLPIFLPKSRHELVSKDMREEIGKVYGQETLLSLLVGLNSEKLLILRGPPGSGKSHLAHRLIDVTAERRIIVPVSSIWKGPEDLLGYVNPIDNFFEPTPVTTFLANASEAWENGDSSPRLVVFEEFNLSQPEHWFSDLLVRLQFPPESKEERTLWLGGSKIRGHKSEKTAVYLPENLIFVATLNTDHTTRSLSPRILDRSVVINVDPPYERVLRTLAIELPTEAENAVRDLDFILRSKQCTFSFRAAQSLRAALAPAANLQLTENQALDLILVQEVFTKLRFLAGDPLDESVLADLTRWAETHATQLTRCRRLIEEWKTAMEEGRDVVFT